MGGLGRVPHGDPARQRHRLLLGVLPGVGPTASTFIAYAAERKFTKHPERFGNGSLDAVASVESANNAAVTGTLVPMLTLGIPGSGLTAVLLAAFTLQGIRPGPLLMIEQPDLVWGLIASMFVGNAMLLVMNLPLAPFFASLLRIPYAYMAPGILLLSLVGAYATNLRLFTVGLSIVFGIVGYLMIKARLPRAPLILGAGARADHGIVAAPVAHPVARQPRHLLQAAGLGRARLRRARLAARPARPRRGRAALSAQARAGRHADADYRRGGVSPPWCAGRAPSRRAMIWR